MAKNTGEDFRRGSVDDRSQSLNPKTDLWTKRNDTDGRFMQVKRDGAPFKGVAKEVDTVAPEESSAIWARVQSSK